MNQELHAHLNGSISQATIQKLLDRHVERLTQEAAATGVADGGGGGGGGREGVTLGIPEAWQTTIAKGEQRALEE